MLERCNLKDTARTLKREFMQVNPEEKMVNLIWKALVQQDMKEQRRKIAEEWKLSGPMDAYKG